MSGVGELLAGRYRLQRQLGSGAMGIVWQAVDERLQRTVALKQLIPQAGLDTTRAEEARQRAMREGRLAARLHHPNAVAVHDATEHEGLPVLVMEYVPSRSLADVLAEQGTMAPEVVAGIGAQAASALEAAHAVGIVHRDIKPGNILLGDDGTVKITDFGISLAVDDVAVTQTGILAGTPAYLAPEVAQGYPPTPGSDVFSLAATLHEAVEGRTPFDHGSDNSLAQLHVVAAGNVLPLRYTGPLATVLMRMLQPDPARRPGLMQVREAMHAVTTGAPMPAAVQDAAEEDATTQPLGRIATARTPQVPMGHGSNGTRLDARPLAHGPHVATARRLPRHRVLLGASAVAVALLVGVLVALGSGGESSRQPAPSPPDVTAAQLERVVSDYYALLPEHLDNAWRRLSPEMRAQGQARHANFWNSVAEVIMLSPPHVLGKNTVRVGVELTLRDGTRTRELHQFGMINTGGTPLINTDTVLRSEHIAPPSPPPPPAPSPTEHKDEEDKKDEKSKKKEEDKKEEKGKGEERKKGETKKEREKN